MISEMNNSLDEMLQRSGALNLPALATEPGDEALINMCATLKSLNLTHRQAELVIALVRSRERLP